MTSVSVERLAKRRMLSSPVVITAPASLLVMRVIGEHLAAAEHLDDQTHDAGLFEFATHHHDYVSDLADLIARGVENRQPG